MSGRGVDSRAARRGCVARRLLGDPDHLVKVNVDVQPGRTAGGPRKVGGLLPAHSEPEHLEPQGRVRPHHRRRQVRRLKRAVLLHRLLPSVDLQDGVGSRPDGRQGRASN
jgi:hypothetical protein